MFFDIAEDVDGQLLIFHQALIEPRGLAPAQRGGKNVQRVNVGGISRRRLERNVQARHLGEGILDGLLPFGGLLGLGQIGDRWRGLRRNVAEIFLDLRQRFGRLEVTHQGQHGVVRRIVNAKEFLDVFDGGRVQILHGADHRMLVGEVIVDQALQYFRCFAVRLIVHAQPALFLHRVALIVQVRLVHRQRTHAVRFQKQPQIQLIGSERFEIIRPILRGGAVHIAAVVFDQNHVLAFADVFRSLEHHVLEQVRESGVSGVLVVRAHVVGDGYPISWSGMIHRHHDAEAVIQLVLFNRNPQRFGRGLRLEEERTGQKRGDCGFAHM